MTNHYDVIIVGGGMLGLATAYHLARRGARALVLEAGELGGGSSGACTGRAQVAEGHLDPLNLRLIREGLARLETLEEELGATFEWRRIGFLALIDSQHLWDEWIERAAVLTAAGIPTQMLDQTSLREVEPYLNADGFLGAAYALEGLLNPFRFCAAYAGGHATGAAPSYRPRTPVTGMRLAGRRVVAVEAGMERFEADQVAIMCGAWTAPVARLAGVKLPIHHTHAEALVTEPVALPLNRHRRTLPASTDDPRQRAGRVGRLGPSDSHGALVVTEAVSKTADCTAGLLPGAWPAWRPTCCGSTLRWLGCAWCGAGPFPHRSARTMSRWWAGRRGSITCSGPPDSCRPSPRSR